MTRTEIYIESNRRGLAAAQAATAAGDYGTAMTDRAMDATARWLESQGLSAGGEEHQHAGWCFAQGVAGYVLSEKACGDVRFGVGDQPATTEVSVYDTDTAGMDLPTEWHEGSGRYQPADWRAAAARRELWIVRRDPSRPMLVISASAPAGATERVVRVIEG